MAYRNLTVDVAPGNDYPCPMFEDDFILRAVKQAAGMLARALGLKQAGQHDEAQQTLKAAYDELLGPSREFLDSVDGATLYRLVANVEVARALASACALEAGLCEEALARGKALQRAQQARDLLLAARSEDGSTAGDAELAELHALLQRLGLVC